MSEIHYVRDIIKVEIEGDLVIVTTLKDWTYEAAVEYFKILDVVRARNEKLFIISAGNQTTKVPNQQIRRMIADWTAKNTFSGMAIYGIAPFMRQLATLIFNAANMFRRGSAHFVIVKDEAAARRWIEERRAALDAQAPQSTRSPGG